MYLQRAVTSNKGVLSKCHVVLTLRFGFNHGQAATTLAHSSSVHSRAIDLLGRLLTLRLLVGLQVGIFVGLEGVFEGLEVVGFFMGLDFEAFEGFLVGFDFASMSLSLSATT